MTDTPQPAKPMKDAPKTGKMLWLLVDYTEGEHPLEDARKAWTLGFNNLEDTGTDEWQFVGWCWSQDCFTEGRGEVIGWLPCNMPHTVIPYDC